MGLFDRTLLALYSLVISLCLLVGLFIFFGWTTPLDFLTGQIADKNARLFYVLFTAIFFMAGLRFFWLSVKRKKMESATGQQSVVHENEHGQVRIALKAIENLVEKEVSQTPGIREVKPGIIYENGEIIINVNVTVTPDVKIPELSEHLQAKIRDRVLEVTGVQVESIWVAIDNITAAKPRVE